MTLVSGVVDMWWDTSESAPWIALATYVRKLTMLESESTNLPKFLRMPMRGACWSTPTKPSLTSATNFNRHLLNDAGETPWHHLQLT
jgi:hypothetical protein